MDTAAIFVTCAAHHLLHAVAMYTEGDAMQTSMMREMTGQSHRSSGDVTDVVQVERRMEHAALHDPLTCLPNRALLLDRMTSAPARAGNRARRRCGS